MAGAQKMMIFQRSLCHTDVVQEPDTPLAPISGYENMPLVSLKKAIEPLVNLLPNIHFYIDKASERYRNPGDGLTKDESISIMLYTMSWEPCKECLYFALNAALRSPNRQDLKPWFLFLRLLLNGLFRLPPISGNIYRGINSHMNKEYMKGKTIIWWEFSSCTRALSVLESKPFSGHQDERTMFIIECHSGRDISKHSYFPEEKEVLLLAATQLEVTSRLYQKELHMIEMKEIQPSKPLLKPVSVVITLDEICSPGSRMFAPNFILPKPKTISEVSGTITSRGKSNVPTLQSVVSSYAYQNSVVEKNIAENRYSPELILKSMNLTDQDMKIVAIDALRTTTTMVILNLENNKIGSRGVQYLCDHLKNNKTITTFSLRSNPIGDKGAQYLSGLLLQMTKITTLDLSKTQIAERGAYYLSNALRENRTIRTLNLSSNRLGALGIGHICQALKQKSVARLTTLILSFNDVGDQGSQYLRDALRENTTLTSLELERTQIKAQGIHYLNDALRQNTTLLRLNVLHNPFGERGSQYLYDLRRRNKKLKVVF